MLPLLSKITTCCPYVNGVINYAVAIAALAATLFGPKLLAYL